MRTTVAIALALAALLAVPSTLASSHAFAFPVNVGDSAIGQGLKSFPADLGYFDINLDGELSLSDPDDPVYLDLDRSGSVTYGDLRLTGYWNYGAGSLVGETNVDLGKTLTDLTGWFAKDANNVWYVDTDASRTLSAGDVRLTGSNAGSKLGRGATGLGAELTTVQQGVNPANRFGWTDPDGDNQHGTDEAFYVDAASDLAVSVGDLRIQPTGITLDDGPTRDEFDSTVGELEAADEALADDIATSRADLEAEIDRLEGLIGDLDEEAGTIATQLAELEARRATNDRWLWVLGFLDLALIVGVFVHMRRGASGGGTS